MERLAEDLWRLALTPRDGINAYLLGDVLVDAGVAPRARRLLGRLAGRAVRAHALTHAHWDHTGGSKAVCETLGVPCWASAGDTPAVEAGRPVVGDTRLAPLLERGGTFPAQPVARQLREGDEVGGFRVVETPGHSPGHISFWRESDRVLVIGDTFFNLHMITTRPGLHQPPDPFTVDPPTNRDSMRRLAELEPELALFGHGPPLPGAAPRLQSFVAGLPRP